MHHNHKQLNLIYWNDTANNNNSDNDNGDDDNNNNNDDDNDDNDDDDSEDVDNCAMHIFAMWQFVINLKRKTNQLNFHKSISMASLFLIVVVVASIVIKFSGQCLIKPTKKR